LANAFDGDDDVQIRHHVHMSTACTRVLPTLWATLTAAGLGACARTVVVTLDYAMGAANPLKRVPFYESEWHPACAGGGPSSEAFEAGVPDLARGSTVHVYATAADAVTPVRTAVDQWGVAVGLRGGYRLLVSPKLKDLRLVRQ
jgi:hypothetical protein